jgi:colicin import membrane protein
MGKDSLIKSTSKKKAGAKKAAVKKTTKKAAVKTTAKKKTPKTTKKPAMKTASKAAPKTTKKTVKAAPDATKAKAKAAPVKKAAPKPVKKATVKELILKTFEPLQPKAPAAAAPARQVVAAAAPPIISSTDPEEIKRLRALLMQKFSMEDVKAAAKEPETLPEPVIEAQTAAGPKPAPRPEESAGATAAPAPQKKAAAEENAYITVEPPETKAEADPVARAAKIAAAVAAAVIFLLLSISYNNSSKYYIFPRDNAIEIWKGRFSPKDTMFYMVLHGVELADPPAAVYTSEQVYPLIFDYYLDKADMLLEVPGLPDFEGIRGYLHQAQGYVVSGDMRARVSSRLNNIERMILLYKAEVAMSRGTVDSLQAAIKLLKQADSIAASDMQSQEIVQTIEAAREQIAALKASGE